MIGLLWILLFNPAAEAHIMGSASWCLANSPVHFECQFEDHELCMQTAEKKSKNFEHWECVPYPMDFRNIPKSGETPLPVSTTTTTIKASGH